MRKPSSGRSAVQSLLRLFLPVTFSFFLAASLCSSADENVSITPRYKAAEVNKDASNPEQRYAELRVDTALVQVNVTVSDSLNHLVAGLKKEHFRLFEDKVEQTILHCSSEDVPLSIGLVFDTSASMGPKLQKSREATAQFFKTANPRDEFFLIEFNDRPQLILPFTTDTEEIQNRLAFARASGNTALLDSLYVAVNEMKKAHNPRKAILIISDGGDNNSRYTEREVKNAVRESDIEIYGIGIFEPMTSRGRTPEELTGPGLLSGIAEWTGGRTYAVDDRYELADIAAKIGLTPEELMGPGLSSGIAERTGGRTYAVDNLNELADIAAKIGKELRNQYLLYYTSKNHARDGKYRHVTVKLVPPPGLPPLKASYRLGYYAPSQ
jgi:Ca-activated chloride channel family protein